MIGSHCPASIAPYGKGRKQEMMHVCFTRAAALVGGHSPGLSWSLPKGLSLVLCSSPILDTSVSSR